MRTIILKTANRPTRVSRLTVRRAVAAAYSAAAAGKANIPPTGKRNAMAAKKTAAKK